MENTSDASEPTDRVWPSIAVVIPARNEADVIPGTLPSRLDQDYPGDFHVFLVDDSSGDGTAEAAGRSAAGPWKSRLTVVSSRPPPEGWSGKVWAMAEGVRAAEADAPDYYLFTDADVLFERGTLKSLVKRAQRDNRQLVSIMARLHADSFWERLLIPAFVHFFDKLYPFRWVSDPRCATAGAAGGCILVRRDALKRAGGLAAVAGELIDDCALAALIQAEGGEDRRPGRLWLGFDAGVSSERAYGGPGPIWKMVARSAYVQLGCSPWILAGTVAGMALLYAMPPSAGVAGLVMLGHGNAGAGALSLTAGGIGAWLLMAAGYAPILIWHRVSLVFAPLLPVAAFFYTLMTLDSARLHHSGSGFAWKGRSYSRP